MTFRRFFRHCYCLAILSILAAAPGCKRPATVGAQRGEKTVSADFSKLNPCDLISSDDVGEIQESRITAATNSRRSDGSFYIAQCVYSAPEHSRSVSLSVIYADPASMRKTQPKDFWREKFRGGEADENKGGEEPEPSGNGEGREEEGIPPRKVENVGDEAFWTAGTLYVLRGEVILRISAGGADTEERKLERSSEIARKAVARL